MKKLKQKTCKACKSKFTPTQFAQCVCDWKCSLEWEKMKKAKKEAKAHTKARQEFRLGDKSLQKKLAQAIVNKWIRLRDDDKPCISCGRHHEGQWHAGHYLSVGSHPHLRYNTRNIHKQCAPCNNYLSGNVLEFRKGLVKRYGSEFVDRLESYQSHRKFTIDEVIAIGSYYKRMIKEVEK